MDLISFLATTPGTFLLISSFILFIFLVKKIFSILLHAALIAMASVAFPFAANYVGLTKFLGIELAMNFSTVIFFVTLGLAVYFLYLVGKMVYSAVGFFSKGKKSSK